MGNRLIQGVIAIIIGVVWLYNLWPGGFLELQELFSLSRGIRDKSGGFAVILTVALISFGLYELYLYVTNKNT